MINYQELIAKLAVNENNYYPIEQLVKIYDPSLTVNDTQYIIHSELANIIRILYDLGYIPTAFVQAGIDRSAQALSVSWGIAISEILPHAPCEVLKGHIVDNHFIQF